jgi:hypothetical protein
MLGLIGIIFCGVGLVSFALELSHYFIEHQRTWIASAPIALMANAIAIVIHQFYRERLAPVKSPVRSVHTNY